MIFQKFLDINGGQKIKWLWKRKNLLLFKVEKFLTLNKKCVKISLKKIIYRFNTKISKFLNNNYFFKYQEDRYFG